MARNFISLSTAYSLPINHQAIHSSMRGTPRETNSTMTKSETESVQSFFSAQPYWLRSSSRASLSLRRASLWPARSSSTNMLVVNFIIIIIITQKGERKRKTRKHVAPLHEKSAIVMLSSCEYVARINPLQSRLVTKCPCRLQLIV